MTSAAEPTAATKTVHHVKHHRAQAQTRAKDSYAALEPYRSMGFVGAYPGEYARRRAAGDCVFDLGYGRFEYCN
jgi:hypothetical protein